jgi:hypothetical protein
MEPKPQTASKSHTRLAGLPRNATKEDYIAQTIALWEPRAGRQLTHEDAREIIENVSGFFRILHEWDQAERREIEAAKARHKPAR